MHANRSKQVLVTFQGSRLKPGHVKCHATAGDAVDAADGNGCSSHGVAMLCSAHDAGAHRADVLSDLLTRRSAKSWNWRSCESQLV